MAVYVVLIEDKLASEISLIQLFQPTEGGIFHQIQPTLEAF